MSYSMLAYNLVSIYDFSVLQSLDNGLDTDSQTFSKVPSGYCLNWPAVCTREMHLLLILV